MARRARDAPKVELHVHLDGSFAFQTMYDAAKKFRDQLPEERVCPWEDPETKTNPVVRPRSELGDAATLDQFKEMVTCKAEMGLYPLLQVFYRYLPVVMGRNELLEELAYRFCEAQKESNVIYSEVRYSPHEFMEEQFKAEPPSGMARDIVVAVSKGLDRGMKDFGIIVKQILCCINFCPQWSKDTVDTALASRDLGVVGVDLASGEHHFDIEGIHAAHKAAMEAAHVGGMPITIHAGEDGPAKNVKTAVEVYHAVRIGHGYNLLKDADLYQELKDKIHLECCPTSSLLTKAVSSADSWTTHPVRRFLEDGASVGLNTDDPRVFDITFNSEMDLAQDSIGLSLDQICKCTVNAIEAAFCASEMKASLRQQVEAWYSG
mmetsp:Transcript_30168/g.77868  ORF Transcript_30168/g.77868 Transcript_30168/m.77868 type:complete len:377 (+) Transcript_30168:19-1149(+)